MRGPGKKSEFNTHLAPLLQGELDGLCGVYTIINATRWLCPEGASDDFCDELFRRLLNVIATVESRPVAVVCRGMGDTLLKLLLTTATEYVKDVLDVEIAAQNLKLAGIEPKLPAVWKMVVDTLSSQCICILALGGRIDHWTLAVAGNAKRITLFDSNELNSLLRSRTTLQHTNRRIQLRPRHIIRLSRN